MPGRPTKAGPIGLDIGASGIRMLQLGSEAGQPSVVAAARSEIPPTITEAAELNAWIRTTISQSLRQHPFRGNKVVTALGSDEFQMKNLRLPRMPAAEMDSAAEFEAKERFDFGGAPVQYRHVPVGEVRHGDALKEELIVFAAPDDVVQARLELLQSIKLLPVAIDVAPCAVARCFVRFLRRSEDADAINVFVDVGYGATSIIMTRGPKVAFLKLIDLGGRAFNEAVAKVLGVNRQEAGDLRIRIMRESCGRRAGDRSNVQDKIKVVAADAVRPFAERLGRDVQLCMRYFAVTFRGRKPESVTLVGGEATEPSLARTISEAIDMPCMIGHPLRGIAHLGAIATRDRRTVQPAWAVAGGLALWGSPWVRTEQPMSGRPSLAALSVSAAGA